jgi:transketolase
MVKYSRKGRITRYFGSLISINYGYSGFNDPIALKVKLNKEVFVILNDAFLTRARKRLIQMHYESGVGHIGGNLSSLDAMLVVFHEYMQANDDFILSKGHSAGALYISLWTKGKLADSDLQLFHKDETLLGGHPPVKGIPEIPFATGSLGHGLSLAAGTALARRLKNEVTHTFCLASDGEFQEGSTWEAVIFLAHHRLNNLTVLIDHNGLQGFGNTTDIASMAPLQEKLQGFDIQVIVVPGHDLQSIRRALKMESDKPKFIILQTVKGHGISFMENKMEWHYLPLKEAQYAQALAELDAI